MSSGSSRKTKKPQRSLPMASEMPAHHRSWLRDTYFNDSILSDLTIKLGGDEIVHVHRVVLCRRSTYFAKLITGSFMEKDAKQIELKDDNTDAMMAMLRFLYDLPYNEGIADEYDGNALLHHAEVYVVAEKYGVDNLKAMIHQNMRKLLEYNGDKTDLAEALRTIIEGTPTMVDITPGDYGARNLLVSHVVKHLNLFAKADDFMAMVAELPDLGAEIIRCQFAGRALSWVLPERNGV